MEEIYLKSIQALKDYDCVLSVKEWNKIAKKYNFLSAKAMCFISSSNWNELCRITRKK